MIDRSTWYNLRFRSTSRGITEPSVRQQGPPHDGEQQPRRGRPAGRYEPLISVMVLAFRRRPGGRAGCICDRSDTSPISAGSFGRCGQGLFERNGMVHRRHLGGALWLPRV